MKEYRELTNDILQDNNILSILETSNLSEQEKYDLVYTIISRYSSINRVSKRLYSDIPTDYVSFDIETTGLSYSDKMIQIAAVKYIDKKEVEQFSSFVNTEGVLIPLPISYLTGITNDNIKDAPSLTEVMDKFMIFIGDFPLVGHNVFGFELPRINRWANINLKNRVIIDTYEFAKTIPLEIENYKLETLKNYYNIRVRSHNALEDSRTTAIILEKFREKDYRKVSILENRNKIFENKTFCYTGAIKMGRNQLEEEIICRGGRVVKSMSKKVDFLIASPQIATNLSDGKRSRKEIRYDELVSEGHCILKITEEEFLNML